MNKNIANSYRIKEFESFVKNRNIKKAGYHYIPEKIFDMLELFILENNKIASDYNHSSLDELFSISVRNGIKVISARNYVGLITMKDGTTIEIIPKLDNADEVETMRVFRKMLKTVDDLPFKSLEDGNVKSDQLNLFEIFIKMFLSEVDHLVSRGIKYGYVQKNDSLSFMKGKLNVNQHIRHNLSHKERFFVEYDEFSANRSENKLIKSTLKYVSKYTREYRNKKNCRRLLDMFEDIEESKNYELDFSKCTSDRNMKEYEQLLKWCKVFLTNKSFSVFKGSNVAFALLFPMEKLFEGYVAYLLKRSAKGYVIKTQDTGKYLFDEPKKFALRPDLVAVKESDKSEQIILDTKWKMLSPSYTNYGISQNDMYQMYVYHEKYNAKRVILIYPYSNEMENSNRVIEYKGLEPDSLVIEVCFFDLLNTADSIDLLINRIRE